MPTELSPPAGSQPNWFFRVLALAQGIYYLIIGVWPLVSIDTFQMVTGPKTDLWLVETVAVLIIAISIPLLVAGRRGRYQPEIMLLAVGSAVGLTAIDVIYSTAGRISKIYLADAAAEVVLILGWTVAWFRERA